MPGQDPLPGLRRLLRIPEELQVLGVDHALVEQVLHVEDALPILTTDQDDRDRIDLAGLDERECLEELVERAETTRECHQSLRAQQEVQLAKREIVESEAQIGGHVGVGILLVGQVDVETDRLGPDVVGAAIGGLHHTRATARHDDHATVVGPFARLGDETPERASDVVVATLRQDALGAGQAYREHRFRWIRRPLDAQALDLPRRRRGLGDARSAEDDDRVLDAMLLEQRLGLQVVELEP